MIWVVDGAAWLAESENENRGLCFFLQREIEEKSENVRGTGIEENQGGESGRRY